MKLTGQEEAVGARCPFLASCVFVAQEGLQLCAVSLEPQVLKFAFRGLWLKNLSWVVAGSEQMRFEQGDSYLTLGKQS